MIIRGAGLSTEVVFGTLPHVGRQFRGEEVSLVVYETQGVGLLGRGLDALTGLIQVRIEQGDVQSRLMLQPDLVAWRSRSFARSEGKSMVKVIGALHLLWKIV